MKRMIDSYLREWRSSSIRTPIILRGARQVGKTHAARELGKLFSECLEINFELLPEAKPLFEENLLPDRIVRELELLSGKKITPGLTLLFFDEIQAAPKALQSLRYFFELMPELHVIAAGSLIDFEIDKIGLPVGRVQSLYMYPMSFVEFLAALGEHLLIEEIMRRGPEKELPPVIHHKCLRLVAEYMALGGMPAVVDCWRTLKKPRECTKVHKRILTSYRQDFGKYARLSQVKYVSLLFKSIPQQLGKKFKYSEIEGDFRKRDLRPALDLLEKAGIACKVHSASGSELLGSHVDEEDYKVLFLDVGLAQSELSLNLSRWFIQPFPEFIKKGAHVESFVGQELLAYSDPLDEGNLYYWNRKGVKSAEIDYLIQLEEFIIPVEVKSADGRSLKSLHVFLNDHQKTPYGIRFSAHNYSVHEKIHSYPLYAIAKVASTELDDVRKSIEELYS